MNGELHELWDTVTVNTLAARTRDVGDGYGLRPQDYEQIAAESEQYEAVFGTFMSKQNLLKWISDVALAEYIDKSTGTCNFEQDSFKELLEWCLSMPDEMEEGSDADYLDQSQLVLSVESIQTPARVAAIADNFGEDFTFVGFPTGGEGSSYFSCVDGSCMAIPVNAANKEGAWALIKDRLSLTSQLHTDELPVNAEALERAASSLDDSELSKLNSLLENTKNAKICCDEDLKQIILSVGQAYLAGDKSLDEAVSLIQSKASVYMAEQYG